MSLPRIIVIGASGFLGRHLLEQLKERAKLIGIARRSQLSCGAPIHPNILWHQVDITDRPTLASVFEEIRNDGGADFVIHLAAHYDFTGQDHPEYRRTNVDGLRSVLEECRLLRPKRFVFSSSVAASRFPAPGAALDERSSPDGDHPYAVTKRIGEEMLAEYADLFPSTIVRFAAMFSDWCEYPPLFVFLETWLSSAWNQRILGGQGRSAIPYLHIDDGVVFLLSVLEHADARAPGEVLVAGADGCTSHRQLFEQATEYDRGERTTPLLMPRPLCRVGMHARLAAGRLLGELPFERPWMAEFIDLEMKIDSTHSRARLDWEPRQRLEVLRRLPFLLENRKSDPVEWMRRNQAAMKKIEMRPNLAIYRLLHNHREEIADRFTAALLGPGSAERFPTYQTITLDDHHWNHRLVIRHMMQSVRTHDRSLFLDYCRDLARYRFKQGFDADEINLALETLHRIFLDVLRDDPESARIGDHVGDQITTTIAFGCDRIRETFDQLRLHEAERAGRGPARTQGGRLPRLLLTGASGFLGRALLDRLKERFEIIGLARRSQSRCAAPVHPNIRWFQVDIGDGETLAEVFRRIREGGPVDHVVHLAAHYDFSGIEHAEYRRTNVDGLRNVLDECRTLRPGFFVFGSSLAACGFRRAGEPVNEDSPLENDHVYARTKRAGEAMLAEYDDAFDSVVVRFAALFSDWCEYPPIYMFLRDWLSESWRSRLVAGAGRSAIPYLHVSEAADFVARVLERRNDLTPREVLIASTDGCVSHEELRRCATRYVDPAGARSSIHMPRLLCGVGIALTNLLGRLGGELPFERPWMARYIDLQLPVDASRTRRRLGWRPRVRLDLLERLPLLIENRKADPVEWNRVNREAMKTVHMRANLRVYWLLEKHSQVLTTRFTEALVGPGSGSRFPTYARMSGDDLDWHVRLILRHLSHTVRTLERGVLLSYCRDLAERRYLHGFTAEEVCEALRALERVCLDQLRPACEQLGIEASLEPLISTTLRFGCDQVLERFEDLQRSYFAQRPATR